MREISFTAIDFETANSQRGSVCAVGLARVVEGEIVERTSWLIKPPRGYDRFEPRNVGIHGIRPQDVVTARNWEESLAGIFQFAAGGHFVAYNARFDSSVMRAASEATGVDLPQHEFYCALELSRGHLDIPRHKLNDVTEHLDLPAFEHHEAGADAIACASVVLAIARMRQLQSTAEMWAAPIGAKRAKTVEPAKTRTPVGGQINYTTERTLRLADLPQPNLSADPDHPFFGQTFCFTGELQSFSRLDAMAAVADCGAINRQGITKKTTYVVVGRSDSTHSASVKDLGDSGKERKALDYIALGQQLAVLGEREFVQLLSAKAGGKILPSVPIVAAGPTGALPTSSDERASRPIPATVVPKRRSDSSGDRAVSTGSDTPTEGPRWLVNLKRVFRLN
jgi:DNA polymerase-3 subunit epsilon